MLGLRRSHDSQTQRGGPVEPAAWGRGRLLAILSAVGIVAVVLLGGLIWAGYAAISGHDDTSSTSPRGATSHSGATDPGTVRAQIASRPMLKVPAEAAFPGEDTAALGSGDGQSPSRKGPITVPAGNGTVGPAQVLTGFPPTTGGAVAQLAAIDVAALQSMSTPTLEEVYIGWTLPGGAPIGSWWMTRSVSDFLDAGDMGQVKDANTTVAIEPAAALVKGTDGPGWATVCVLMRVTAAQEQQGQAALGDCQRMQWTGGRWMIAPGTPPPPGPSTWPGTDLARQVGWRTWTVEDPTEEPDQ